MRYYCMNEECDKKPKGQASCTALEDSKDCPERKKDVKDNKESEVK